MDLTGYQQQGSGPYSTSDIYGPIAWYNYNTDTEH